jgi:hypothetical protein
VSTVYIFATWAFSMLIFLTYESIVTFYARGIWNAYSLLLTAVIYSLQPCVKPQATEACCSLHISYIKFAQWGKGGGGGGGHE